MFHRTIHRGVAGAASAMRSALARAASGVALVALASNCGGAPSVVAADPGAISPPVSPLRSLASPQEIANSPLAMLEDGRLKRSASGCSGSDVDRGPNRRTSPDVVSQGTLFVADFTSTGPVEEFDAAGTNPNPYGSITTGLDTPYGMAVDKSGTLYVTNNNPNNVKEYPQGASSPTVSLNYQVLAPMAVGIDPAQDVYVVNDRGGPIVIFPPGQTMPSGYLSGFYYPTDVAWDSAGNLYVVDHLYPGKPHQGAVLKFKPGATKGVSLKLQSLWYPTGVVIDKNNDVIVSNLGNNTITEYAPGATVSKRTITAGICDPVYMAVNSSDDVFVANDGSNLVTMYKPTLKQPSATLTKDLKALRGLAINPKLKAP
jgi:hypothetical protein